MSEDLTPDQKNEIWLIACELGIDTGRARAEWERRKAQNKPQPKPEPQLEPIQEEDEELDEEEEEPEEKIDISETQRRIREKFEREQESEIRKKKLKILDKIEQQLNSEEKQNSEFAELKKQLSGQIKLNAFWSNVLGSSWEPILREIVFSVDAQIQGRIVKLVYTFELEGDKMKYSKGFLDKDGHEVVHELTHKVEGEPD